MSHRRVLTRFSFTVLATLLVLASPLMRADDENRPDADDGWSAWTALSKGYVARRKEPPMAKQAEAGKTKLARLEKREPAGNGKGEVSGVLAAESNANEKVLKVQVQSPFALWLRTREEGLYRVSIDSLAAGLGNSAKSLRKEALKGEFSLTNAGEPVSWHFDATRD